MTSSKHTSSHATHASTAPTTATSATPTPSVSVSAQAGDALASLKQLTGALPIDDAMPPKALAAAKVSNRVPVEVMSIAANILNDAPSQYPQFDATEAQAAVDYEQAMVPVAQAAQVLSTRITKSVLKRRSAMATQALALHAVMKGTARLPTNQQTRTQLKSMSKLLTTKRKSRATAVTKKDTAGVATVIRSQKKAQAAQAAVTAATGKAAIAGAEAVVRVTANAGVLPQTPAPSAPPVAPTAPVAPASSAPVVSPTH